MSARPRLTAAVAAAALAAALLAAAVVPGPAHADGPRVRALVVGKDGWTVGPRTVRVDALRIGRCRLGEGLPIGVLRALRVAFRTEGSCGALYVSQVGRDRERGAGGWVFKVDGRVPSSGAAAAASRLRGGERVIWFWCSRAGRCERTLDTRARSRDGRMRVVVRAYDDFGRSRRVGGATVIVRRLGTSARREYRTGRNGAVTIRVRPGARYRVDSRRPGYVRGFWTEVRAR